MERLSSMVEVLASYAATRPEQNAIVDSEGCYTYEDTWKKVRSLCRYMKEKGLKKGDRILAECTQNADFIILNLATELAGGIFVPVEHKAALNRVQDIYDETEPAIVLCEQKYEVEFPYMSLSEFLEGMTDEVEDPVVFPDKNDVAEILYTTGTTGKSKGIEVLHINNIAIAENVMYGTEMKPGSTELIPLPLSHSHAIRCYYANLLNGGTVVLVDGIMKVKMIVQMIEDYHVTAMDLSPSAVLMLMRLSKGRLGEYSEQLDYIQIGTAALPEETKQLLLDKFPGVRLYNFYGSTESGRTCVLDFSGDHNQPNCIGRPTKNARFIITDEERNEIKATKENPGLIATAGDMNMRGYYKQPELTAETMQNGFIYTNDLGYIDEEGYVFVFGRQDDIINYKGIKIAPEEIEEKVREYPAVLDCACVPKKDEISGQVPKLFLSLKEGADFVRADLIAYLEKVIDKNKMPKEIEVIDEIPRTYNGKLQRKKLMGK